MKGLAFGSAVLLLGFSCVSVPKEPLPQKPKLPSIELEHLPILDPATGKLRALTADELSRTRTYLRNQRAKATTETERNLANGDCFNNSGYWAGIYGPYISGRLNPSGGPYDNDLYMVPPGYKTPEGWDCDGFFIPSDVSVNLTSVAETVIRSGPGAAKIFDTQWATLDSISRLEKKMIGAAFIWIGPGDPTNWFRPAFPQQDLDDLADIWRPKPPVGH